MERDINLDEISDGKLYETNDLVKLGCGDCAGCSACCHEMGDTIILDPYDIWQLTGNLHCTFEQLMGEGKIALSVYDGVILPHLRLEGPQEGCLFLNEAGRCSIHPFRPGMCRLFPLGRIYVIFFRSMNAGRRAGQRLKLKNGWIYQKYAVMNSFSATGIFL